MPSATQQPLVEKCRVCGTLAQVLVEGPNPKGDAGTGGTAFGRSRHNKLVFFDGDGEALKGGLVMVNVDRVHAYSLYGARVD